MLAVGNWQSAAHLQIDVTGGSPRSPVTSRTSTEPSDPTNKPDNLGLVYINARSLKSVTKRHNKLEQLSTIVSDYCPDILVLTETWLNSDVRDSEILPSDFVLHRKDRAETRPDKRGGGVLIGVRKTLSSVRRSDLEPEAEVLIAELKPVKHAKIALIACYRPPNSDAKLFADCLNQTLVKVFKEFQYVTLIGDFNFPGVDWSLLGAKHGVLDTDVLSFLEVISTFSLVQLNNVPSTRHGNILDLILTNTPELFLDVGKLPCDFTSDHVVLYSELLLVKKPEVKQKRVVFNFKHADFNSVRSEMAAAPLTSIVNDCTDVEHAWKLWLETVTNVVESCVPKLTIRDCTAPPWVDAEVRHLQQLKRTAWRNAKRNNKWAKFRRVRNKLKSVTRMKQRQFLKGLGEQCKTNPKRFWTYYRSKTKNRSLPQTIEHEGRESQEAATKASLFNEYFHSVFTRGCDSELPNVQGFVDYSLGTVHFSVQEVLSQMKSLDVNKACGPDNLSPRVLKECYKELAPSLTLLFEKSMQTGTIPSQWRQANVVPVYKKGSKTSVENYRPISLLCVASKLMERCVYNHMLTAVKPFIHPLQHGFMKGRSCTTQLLSVYNRVGQCLDRGKQTDIVYLDFSKAFDSVSHRLLIHKLQIFGLHGNLLNWVTSYLSGRNQRVIVEGSYSDWLPVTSGVPQGSILGPLLFLLYINDMPLVANCSNIALFADDAKCIKKVSSLADALELQSDLSRLHNWSKEWCLCFNVDKCKVLTVSRALTTVSFDYNIGGCILEHVGNFKDLGVVVDSSLTFKDHVSSLICRANAVSGMIKRTVGYNAPRNVTLQLYTALTRSSLDYCSPVWSPYLNCDIKQVESVQRSMTRYVLGYPNETSYQERCLQLNILPLSYRREVNDLILLFKYIHSIYDVSLDETLELVSENSGLRSGSRGLLLKSKLATTEHFKRFYFNRVVVMWNNLPRALRDCQNLIGFKKGVEDFYFVKLSLSYDTDKPCTWTTGCQCQVCSRTSV